MLTIVNRSTLVPDDAVKMLTRACAHQLRYDVAPAYGMHPVPVVYSATPAEAAPGSRVLTLFDTIDDPEALGYHTELPNDVESAVIGCKIILDQPGATFLTGDIAVSSVVSHEVCEWFVDPHCNLTADDFNGTAYAYEVCDPVESDSYDISVYNPVTRVHEPVSVSNFVLPSWFDPQGAPGAKDYLSKVTAPFELSPGGYAVKISEGQATQVFGENYAEWRKVLKSRPDGRGQRFLAGRSGSADSN